MGPDIRFNSRFGETHPPGWSWQIRSVVSLLVLIALSSLSLAVMARDLRRQPTPAWPAPKKAAPRVPARVIPVRPTDRFVIAADPDIDPKMVINADPNIDPEMVANPEAGGRPSWPMAPVRVPGGKLAVPRRSPGPGQVNPHGRNP